MYNSIKDKILSRIYSRGRGWAFSANDFLSDFKRYEVDASLAALSKQGVIRRCIRGIYDYPMHSSILHKEVAPDIDKIAQALARKFRWQIVPNGDTALNYLGISTQIPGMSIYLSNGPSSEYDVDGRIIKFQHVKQREAAFSCPESALLTQALRALGKENITPQILEQLKSSFTAKQWALIRKDTTSVAGWIYEYIQQLSEGAV